MKLSPRFHPHPFFITAVVSIALSCGGGKSSQAGGAGGTPGESSGGAGGEGAEAGAAPSDAGAVTGPETPTTPPAAVTFVLKNSHTSELAFNMNKGWSTNIFAYSGKPPKATSILMFPTFCTESCAAPEEGRCPLCEEPETQKEKNAAQKFEKVAAGAELEVPWDGQALVYQKTRGTRDGRPKKCKCYQPQPVAPETYTVKACGLRLTSEVGTNSQLQCVETTMTLPSEEPLRVELDFGAPPPQPKKKKP